jgi:hypothetical protein
MQHWPILYDDGRPYLNAIYSLNEEEIREKYLNVLYVNQNHRNTTDFIGFESFSTCMVVEVDEQTAQSLYGHQFNPVSFRITTQYNSTKVFVKRRGKKKKQKYERELLRNSEGVLLYEFICSIHSSDDDSFTAWYNRKTRKECLSLRNQFYKYFSENVVVNGYEFEQFARSLDSAVDWINY